MAASESLDYRNPFLSAAIVTTDGTRFPLWMKTDPAARTAARLQGTQSLAFVQELSVEIQLAYLPIIKCTLAPPYGDALNFLNSRLIEWGQSQLEVQFGYIQQGPPNDPAGRVVLSDLYSGILLKPEVQLGQDVVITLNAQGVGGFAAVRQEGNLTIKDTRKNIVKKLFERFKVTVDDSEVDKIATTQAEIVAEWNKKPIDFTQAGDSYWTAVLKIVREAGFHSYLVGNAFKVLPASFVFSAGPTKLFRLYDFSQGRLGPVDGGSLGVNRVLPILSVSSPTSAVYLPGSAQGFFIQDINSFDRGEIKKFVGDQQVAAPRTGVGASSVQNPNTLPAADPKTGEGAEQYPGNASDDQLLQQVQSEYAAQTTLMGVQLNMESIGDPTLLPGTVIAVRGIGARLNGNYSTFKVTHTIGGSGYTMSLECVSNVAQALKNSVEALGPVAPEPQVDEQTPLTNTVTKNPTNIQ